MMRVGSFQQHASEFIESHTNFAALYEEDVVKIIETLTQNPQWINELSQMAFDQVIHSVHTSSHRDATTVFKQMLESRHMATMNHNDFNMLFIDFSGAGLPHFPTEQEMRERVALLLDTVHARRIDPIRLKQLHLNFQMGGADTKRIEELMGPVPEPAPLTSKSWCSFV